MPTEHNPELRIKFLAARHHPSRLSQLERAHRTGQLAEKEYRQEKSRIGEGVLATLRGLEV
jgi:hypothetical protein